MSNLKNHFPVQKEALLGWGHEDIMLVIPKSLFYSPQHIKGEKRSQHSGLCAISRNAPLHLTSPTFVDTALFFLGLSCIPCGSNDGTHLLEFRSKHPPLWNSPSHPLEGSSTSTSHYDITGTLFFFFVYVCLSSTGLWVLRDQTMDSFHFVS